MARLFDISEPREISGVDQLADQLMQLGRDFEIRQRQLKEEFDQRKEEINKLSAAQTTLANTQELNDAE